MYAIFVIYGDNLFLGNRIMSQNVCHRIKLLRKNIPDVGTMEVVNRTLGLLGKILDIYGLATNMSSEKSTAFVFLKALCKFVCRVSVHKLM